MRRLLILAVLILFSPTLRAGQLEGVTMPDSVQVGGKTLMLNGMGLRTKAFFNVYVAGLYLPSKMNDTASILGADTERQLMMKFMRTVTGGQICGAWKEGLEKNTPNASAELKGQFDTLCTYMEKARDGDVYTFTYIPGTGTQVTFNGTSKGAALPGKDFADALFKCWIGDHPPSAEFKAGLLGH